MVIRFKKALYQKMDGKEAHEKLFNISAIKTTIRMAKIQKTKCR